MDRFDKMMKAIARDDSVPEQVWAKYTETLRNLPEKEGAAANGSAAATAATVPAGRTAFTKGTAFAEGTAFTNGTAFTKETAYQSKKASPVRRWKYAVILAASLCLVGGTVYAATNGGLYDYLTGFMGQPEVEAGLQGEPDVVNIQQSEESSYGNLWTITETWYDGAKVYFYAEQPESIVEDDKLEVIHKDHMTVNGIDHLLNSSLQADGSYLCWVDVSDIEDTETLELSIHLKLLKNQYDWSTYSLTADGESGYDYAADVTVVEEQTLTFTVEGTSAAREGILETVEIEQAEETSVQGEVEITEAVLSPSTLTLRFTYRLSGEDAEELMNLPTMKGALFFIQDEFGNQIGSTSCGYWSSYISEVYTDEDGKLCRDFELNGAPGSQMEGQPSLDTSTSTLTVILYEAEWDEEGKLIPDTETELGWGSFTVSFEE